MLLELAKNLRNPRVARHHTELFRLASRHFGGDRGIAEALWAAFHAAPSGSQRQITIMTAIWRAMIENAKAEDQRQAAFSESLTVLSDTDLEDQLIAAVEPILSSRGMMITPCPG